MRVGIYIDGFNVYYGGRDLCGRGSPGWRWLDLRSLTADILARRTDWPGAAIARVVYCTARINGSENPNGQRNQDIYLKALLALRSVDNIEYGHYVARVKKAPLAMPDPKGRPVLVTSKWPVMVRDDVDTPVRDARFMVSCAFREEKGSDVNVATHLLFDTLTGAIDGAVVISNDSDLSLPIRLLRERIPVGMVNPGPHILAGALRGKQNDGCGRHWWLQLTATDFTSHQLPSPAGRYSKPQSW